MRLGALEIVGILLVVLLIFGPGRIAKVAGELGKGIKEFKDGLSGDKPNDHGEDDQQG
jgi:sec-independent protein translocase protein TatA